MTTNDFREDPYYSGSLNHLQSFSRDTTRNRLRSILRQIKRSQQPVLILHQLKPVAVLISYEQFLAVRHVIDPAVETGPDAQPDHA